MKIITAAEMSRIDRSSPVKPASLMENAGLALASFIHSSLPRLPVCFVCGSGNNGADGFVAARHLRSWGRDVQVLLYGQKNSLSGLPRHQAHRLDMEIYEITKPSSLKQIFSRPMIAVDSLYGTGFRIPLDAAARDILEIMNKKSKISVACDMPSGVSGDSGEADEGSFLADVTVTFEFPKVGHINGRGSLFTGSLEVAYIGTGLSPVEYLENAELTAGSDIEFYFSRRPRDSHKKTFGHVLIVGGSPGMPGAVGMTAQGALRSGAGLVTCASGKSIIGQIACMSMSSVNLPLDEDEKGYLKAKNCSRILEYINKRKVDCIVIGPGLSTEKEPAALTRELAEKALCPMVLDADGLNNMSGSAEMLKNRNHPVILTPHPGELSRLVRTGPGDPRDKGARELAEVTGGTVLLKGYRSIVVSEGRIYINPTGGPAMATGGTGDILAGMCGALLAQNTEAAEAARAAAWVHGRAGDIASWHKGERSVLPEDILENLGKVSDCG